MQEAEADALGSLMQYIQMTHAARVIQRSFRDCRWVEVVYPTNQTASFSHIVVHMMCPAADDIYTLVKLRGAGEEDGGP